jgi:hypothetical protein
MLLRSLRQRSVWRVHGRASAVLWCCPLAVRTCVSCHAGCQPGGLSARCELPAGLVRSESAGLFLLARHGFTSWAPLQGAHGPVPKITILGAIRA